MTRQGLDEVIFSAFDLDRGCRALMTTGSFRRVDLADCPPEQFTAWRVPPECTRIEQALLYAPGDERGRVRVVVFHGVDRELIRPSQRTWDTGGIFDIDMFSRDVCGVYRVLQQQFGWTAFGEPVRYEMGEFDVTQVVAKGPDGLVLAIIEPHKPPSFPLPPFDALSRAFNSTQMVRDLDASLAFYCDVLGWKVLVREDVEDCVEPGADVLGLPMPVAKNLRRRVAIVHPEGVNDGSIELIEIAAVEGQDFSDRALPPNVGLLVLRICVDDVAAYAEQVVARGAVLYSPVITVRIEPFGDVDCCSVRTPDGAILEFIAACSLDRRPPPL